MAEPDKDSAEAVLPGNEEVEKDDAVDEEEEGRDDIFHSLIQSNYENNLRRGPGILRTEWNEQLMGPRPEVLSQALLPKTNNGNSLPKSFVTGTKKRTNDQKKADRAAKKAKLREMAKRRQEADNSSSPVSDEEMPTPGKGATGAEDDGGPPTDNDDDVVKKKATGADNTAGKKSTNNTQAKSATNPKATNPKTTNPKTTKPKKKIKIFPTMFQPADDNPDWHYPDDDDQERLGDKLISALDLAVEIFNNDKKDVVFKNTEKIAILTTLFQTPNVTQRGGDLSSYPACRKMRKREEREPTFVEATTALLLYQLKPPTGMGDCDEWIEMLRHIQVSDTSEDCEELDDLLEVCHRTRGGDAAVPAQQPKRAKANVVILDDTPQPDTPVNDDQQEFFNFAKKIDITTTMENRARMNYLIQELNTRKWHDLATYAAKIINQGISEDDRKTIRTKVISDLNAKLRGEPGTLLPKHYTITCTKCGEKRTF
ncbi:hypothetical protein CFIO01_04208 [Colletotrichum fioriniae PJ7]|uniref:Uncharacterized protein n=1 Tax=Colletotrichum fioriniae PJ7 TaxID=1445577 RepID=A0A010QDN0_9PEZI|nr:hypothetical protein CFIO01_04208 [Colletotrichum fioriniae PJ7]